MRITSVFTVYYCVVMETSGLVSGDSGSESGLGSGHGMVDDYPMKQQPFYFLLLSLLVKLVGAIAVTVPAVMVLGTIMYKKNLHKYHYGFVASLMVCDIVTALGFSLIHAVVFICNHYFNLKFTISCSTPGYLYIAPVASGLLVVTLAVDAILALKNPFHYKEIMTKTKMIIMIGAAWMIAAGVSLPILMFPQLDIQVEDIVTCPYILLPFVPLLVCRYITALLVVGLSIYLYWLAFQAKKKLNTLKYRNNEDGNTKSRVSLVRKYTRLTVTLLLIIIVDGLLRMIRPALLMIAGCFGFHDVPAFIIFTSMLAWVEFINHPVVYGLMLRGVYVSICCGRS